MNDEDKLISILLDDQSVERVCSICSKICEDTANLKIHSRLHGVQFLEYCQQRQAKAKILADNKI